MAGMHSSAQDRGLPAGPDHGGRGAGVPGQAGADHRSVPARRHQRHRRPHDRHAARRPAGQAVRRRQPQRRGRHRRHRACGQRAEGRLHAARRLARERGQSLALQAALRSDRSLHADRGHRHRPERAGRHPDLAGQLGQGARRPRQGRSRAACHMPRPASAASCIWAPSCSSSRPASISCTCRSRAAARRWSTWSAATPRWCSPRRSPRCRTSARASSGRSEPVGRSAAPRLPEVPTIAEAGVPGYEAAQLDRHRGTGRHARSHRREAHEEISAIQNSPEVQQQLSPQGAETLRMSSAEFGDFMAKEMANGNAS